MRALYHPARHEHGGKTDLDLDDAMDVAGRLNRHSTAKSATVAARDCKNTYAVIPKVLADRSRAAAGEPGLFGRTLDTVKQRFVRAVLPLSALWHAGNAVDA
jgi:hypothetical protein